MKISKKIRSHLYKNHIEPAVKLGKSEVTIRAGDVHDEMKLESKMPTVCAVLYARSPIEDLGLSLTNRLGLKYGSNAMFTYHIQNQK